MPRKGKGRGRGASSESDSAMQERRPGPPENARGRGRGRGQAQPRNQEAQLQFAGVGASRVPASQVPPSEPVRRPHVPRPSFPQFFAEETSPTQVGATGLHLKSDEKPAEGAEKTRGVKKETMVSALLPELAGLSLDYKEPVKNMPFVKRPNYATISKMNHIPLLVNYFKLSYKDCIIYHYDIDILDSTKDNKIGKSVMSEGRTLKEDIKHKVKHVERQKRRNMGKAKCRLIISSVFSENETLKRFCPVYDGQKNLFTSQSLPCKKEGSQFPIDISIEGKTKRFFVSITPVEKKDKSNIISLEPLKELYSGRSKEIPYEVLLVYETVMNHREPPFSQVHFRTSFFNLKGGFRQNLGYGLEIWRGYHQNVQLTESCPVVVINLAAKAFHKAGPVIDYACDVLKKDITNIPRLSPFDIKSLSEALKGVQVKVTHQPHPRKYKIKSVTDRSAKDIYVDINNKKTSVPEYINDRYKKQLKFPHLPCLLMQTSTNTTYIPMETCEITEGQPKIGKLSAELTSNMIRSTAVAPKERKENILRTAAQVNGISRNYMGAFGLIMDVSLMQVDGRIITAPQLAYAGAPDDKSRIAQPDKRGVWRVEGGHKFFKRAKIEKWVLISFADRWCNRDALEKYCRLLVQSARKCGMTIDRPEGIHMYGRETSVEEAIIKAKKSGVEMAIVVLNRKDPKHTYDEVKFLADFKHNLVTQCMEDKTLKRITDQITTNVCLKINVKLGGINHILLHKPKIFSRPVIVLGVDAIHWTRGYGYPSILAVVGSLNPTATQYALTCDLQRNDRTDKISQEIIQDMRRISAVVLRKFQEVNNINPVRIIVFRDGVSEGQFQHALNYEVSGLQEACKDLFQKILPITYLVVQKRHQTRLFPARPNDGVGKQLNVPPGTCVDKDIVHPVYYDYFICSHEGIQGTSKPAHYTVLHDDNKIDCEELQQLCYFLCHTYVRCTRSVSLPAPVMYADLAAARAKKYADLYVTSDTASSTGSDSSYRPLPPDVEKAIRNMESFPNNMFFV